MNLDDWISLFDGNRTAVGTEEGGCLRLGENTSFRDVMTRHLDDGHPIGVYPLRFNHPNDASGGSNWFVRWGCVDWDIGVAESWAHARRVQELLKRFGVTAWLELSRSKGVHLWVFGDTWAPAATVRRGLLVACQAVGAPTTEINPKSEGTDDPQFLGNYVRIPYPAGANYRRVMVDEHSDPIERDAFVSMAIEKAGWGQMELLASKWIPPKPVARPISDGQNIDDIDVEPLLGRCRPGTRNVIEVGPTRGQDRSTTLFWVGQLLVKDGNHTFNECVALVRHADSIWGNKYINRTDAERRYEDIVSKAWKEFDE